MNVDSKSELIELVHSALPYSDQIQELDISSEEAAIRFSWKGSTYQLDFNLCCYKVEPYCLVEDKSSRLVRTIIHQYQTITRYIEEVLKDHD